MSLAYMDPCGQVIQQTVTWSLDLIRQIEAGEFGHQVVLIINTDLSMEWDQGEWRRIA